MGCKSTRIGQKEDLGYDALATKTSANFTGSSGSGTNLHTFTSGDRDVWWQTFIGPHHKALAVGYLQGRDMTLGLVISLLRTMFREKLSCE